MTKGDRTRFTFRLPKTLLTTLKEEALKNGCSLNAQILFMLQDWKKNQENKQ